MEPPIPSGTILQNRYYILSVLGQGGFGRTYLAEDRGRFNERCALKELIPPETGAYALDKSKELFQREAESLYKIDHPQVPKFRANFEENGRLFLVQDYVEGKTYRELLNERKAQTTIQNTDPNLGIATPGQASNPGVFSEVEVRQLLLQLLPVLDYLHSKNIIHRDITPDNIIRRNDDGLPMLIDFGVVKQVATQILTSAASAPVTTVGKVGYAPSEQIQTGRAYPSSDLYSLAATAVVLLTGKEPQSLFDDNQLMWNWRRWTSVSDDFANILNRMLSYRPGDRYQSAREVVQALQFPGAAPPTPVAPPPQRPDPNLSQVATMAVGRPPAPEGAPPAGTPHRNDPVIPDPTRGNSIWDNPAAVIGIGAALALVAGLGSYALFSSLRQEPEATILPTETPVETLPAIPEETLTPTPEATLTPTPTPTPTPSPTPTPTPTPSPTNLTQRLNLVAGTPLAEAGSLTANSTLNYIIRGEQGQQLNANLSGEGVLMTVLGPNRNPLNNARRVTQWQGTLPFTGDYIIQLRPVQGLQESDYRLALNLTQGPEPTPTSTSTPQKTYQTQQVTFPAAGGTQNLTGSTGPQVVQRYLVKLEEGQQLTVSVPQETGVNVEIRDPDNQVLESGVEFWQDRVPSSGQYTIDVNAKQQTKFRLTMSVDE